MRRERRDLMLCGSCCKPNPAEETTSEHQWTRMGGAGSRGERSGRCTPRSAFRLQSTAIFRHACVMSGSTLAGLSILIVEDAGGDFLDAFPADLQEDILEPDDLPTLKQLRPASIFIRNSRCGKHFWRKPPARIPLPCPCSKSMCRCTCATTDRSSASCSS